MHICIYIVFLCGSDSKESAHNEEALGSIPGLGRFPREGNGYPFQYSCLENSMDRGGGRKESDTAERLTHICMCIYVGIPMYRYVHVYVCVCVCVCVCMYI